MFGFRSASLAAAAIAGACCTGNYAYASTCPASTTVPYIAATTNTSDTTSCEQYANDNNINGHTGGPPAADDPFLTAHPTFVYLDDTASTGGAANGALTIPTGAGTPSGTWTISSLLVAGYTNFALGIKDGNHDPDWAVFLLGSNWALGGTWAIANPDKNLSHAILYAQACTPETCPTGGGGGGGGGVVPLPAAFWLFGSALAGLGLIGMRRRRRT